MWPNGGAELGSVGQIPTGWERYGAYGTTGVISTEQAHTGSHSVKYWNAGLQIIMNEMPLSLVANVEYVLTFWARTSTGTPPQGAAAPEVSVGGMGHLAPGTCPAAGGWSWPLATEG